MLLQPSPPDPGQTEADADADADVGSSVLHLPANGNTVVAEELRNQLVCCAEISRATIIDGSAVQTIGQAVLQLLVAAQRGAAASGKSCRIINASAPLRKAAEACCLAEAIGLEPEEASA